MPALPIQVARLLMHPCRVGECQCGVSCGVLGQCAVEADISEMSVEQKLAFASFCSVAFPCQVIFNVSDAVFASLWVGLAAAVAQEDCAQDFQQSCPRCLHRACRLGLAPYLLAAFGVRSAKGFVARPCNMRSATTDAAASRFAICAN